MNERDYCTSIGYKLALILPNAYKPNMFPAGDAPPTTRIWSR